MKLYFSAAVLVCSLLSGCAWSAHHLPGTAGLCAAISADLQQRSSHWEVCDRRRTLMDALRGVSVIDVDSVPELDAVSWDLLHAMPQLDNPRMRVRLQQAPPPARRLILERAVQIRQSLGVTQRGDIRVDFTHVPDVCDGMVFWYVE